MQRRARPSGYGDAAIPDPGICASPFLADTSTVEQDLAALQIGDFVTWRGRLCVLRGIDPMSVPVRRAEVEECASGERMRPPLSELTPAPAAAG